jgi:hypothetical protein
MTSSRCSTRRLGLVVAGAALAVLATARPDPAPVAQSQCRQVPIPGANQWVCYTDPVGSGGCDVSVGYCDPDGSCEVNVGSCESGGSCTVNIGRCQDARLIGGI